MREKIREFISALSHEEQVEVVHALIAGMAERVKVESVFVNSDGVVVGCYVPIEKWLEDQPITSTSPYKTAEEAYEAAKNGRSPSEVVAWFHANHPAATQDSTNE